MHIAGKPTRHVAQLNSTQERIVVLYKQIPGTHPDDQFNALVLKVDTLGDIDRGEVMSLIQSDLGQSEEHFANALHKHHNLLNRLHKSGKLQKVSIDEITMKITPSQEIPLRKVINDIKTRNQQPTLDDLQRNISSANPLAADLQEDATNIRGNVQSANNILVQANLMKAEADKKFEEVYRLAPHLRPADGTLPSAKTDFGDLGTPIETHDPLFADGLIPDQTAPLDTAEIVKLATEAAVKAAVKASLAAVSAKPAKKTTRKTNKRASVKRKTKTTA